MNAARQQNRLAVAVRRLLSAVRPLKRLGLGTLVGLALVPVLVVAAFVAWHKWGHEIVGASPYLLTVDSFEISPPPAWVRADIRAEVVRDGSLAGLSVLDPDITVRIARAFELHNWVAKVEWVTKRFGPRVIVQLRYRRPVLMVAATGGGFWPVDTEGVLLPPDEFAPQQTRDFLRLEAAAADPLGPVGTQYGDQRVMGAARLATLLVSDWRELGIQRIVATWETSGTAPPEPVYELFSPAGVRLIWGHAPGRETSGEARAAEKVQRLREHVSRHGPLDDGNALEIDLRPPARVAIVPRTNGLRRVGGN